MSLSSAHGILDGRKVSIAQFGAQLLLGLFHLCGHVGKAAEIAAKLIAKLGLRELAVAHLAQSAVVEGFRHLGLAPSHELGMTLAAEPEELVHGGEELFAHLGAELTAEPLTVVVVDRRATHAVDVPGHVEEELQVVTGHLRVVDVDNPHLPHVVVVGRAHLVVDEARLHGGQP